MKTEADFWACSNCRSINPIRSGRCYSCHTPREVAAIKPTEMPTTGPAAAPATAPPPPAYQATETRAVALTMATVALIAAAGVTAWALWVSSGLRATDGEAAATDALQSRLPLLLLGPAAAFLALLAFGAWISRVVENLPGLGLGYSRVSPTMAFIEPLIPGVNVYSLPARMAEVLRKLEPEGPGLALLVIAWGLVVGPPIVAALLLRFVLLVGTGDDYLQLIGVGFLLAYPFQAIGIVVGLVVVWRIERLVRERRAGAPAAQG